MTEQLVPILCDIAVASEILTTETSDHFKAYLDLKKNRQYVKPLDWWKAHQDEFLEIAKLVQKYLAIQTTSKQRAALSPHTADKVIFLNKQFEVICVC